ncbi:beta-1,6-N-acetylglucosaminyltransferase [Sphingomonas sp. NBWT7]|uniref:beta-1,6-N-acetylglucosaminyltransferase n=1 Tax=Sphingomonas sp. NBWT7 TaxID=2596913 RepID=UPI001CA4E740|nr:beta-1,6-N-acetylglucosaminyltransferase [Sphingomonas sp. NBWT7]
MGIEAEATDTRYETNHRIAFLVIAHQDPAHVQRLVERLQPHRVFIHLDAKVPLDDRWKSIQATFVEPRFPVYWAGYTQIEATLSLMRAALASGEIYRKLVLLSGSCYPIRPIAELERLFAADSGQNYITYIDVRQSDHHQTLVSHRYCRDAILPWRLTSRFKPALLAEKVLRKVHELTIGQLPFRWTLPQTPYHGSQWWALAPEAATYAVRAIDGDPALVAKYRASFAADEQIFQTVIGNSPFAASATGEIPFTGRGTWKTANLHLIHQSLSKWYTIDDLDEVLASGRFFVRKVNSAHSTALLDALDQHASSSDRVVREHVTEQSAD